MFTRMLAEHDLSPGTATIDLSESWLVSRGKERGGQFSGTRGASITMPKHPAYRALFNGPVEIFLGSVEIPMVGNLAVVSPSTLSNHAHHLWNC